MINLRLVRHGHTIWSDTGGVAGRTDIDLSDKGRASVNALAKTFRHEAMATQWFCSPMTRTRETADIIRTVLESTRSYSLPELVFDKRLVELDFGDWEGQTWDEVHKNTPDILANWGEDWVNRSPPNGETFNEQCERCQSWLNDWLTSVQQETEASATVISHGGSIRALVCLCLGWDLSDAMTFNVDPASQCWLQCEKPGGPWQIKAINSLRF